MLKLFKKPDEFWLAVNIFIYQLEQIIYHMSPVILFVCAIIVLGVAWTRMIFKTISLYFLYRYSI